jgi:alkylhydroperoxidase family enzyme
MRASDLRRQARRSGIIFRRARLDGLCRVDHSRSASIDGGRHTKIRVAGWKEEQIAEAVYTTALFASFNRVADAFGIAPQDYLSTGKLTP